MNTRTEELLAAVDAHTAAHYAWADERSGRGEYIDASYSDATTALMEVFDLGDIPHECRELNLALVAFQVQLDAFDSSEELKPGPAYWEAREHIERVRERMRDPVEERTLETMAELKAQGVSDEQIARMYGLVDRGRAQVHLVAKELATPGSVIGPNWVHPDRRAQQEALAKAINRQQGAEYRKPRGFVPCPETAEELFHQGVLVPQAAKMLGLTEEETAAKWEEIRAEHAKAQDATTIDKLKGKAGPKDEEEADDGEELPPMEAAAPPDEYAGKSTEELREIAKAAGVACRPNDSADAIKKKLAARSAAAK